MSICDAIYIPFLCSFREHKLLICAEWIFRYYQLDQSISILRDVGWYLSFLFKFLERILQANSGEPDQTPCSAASCLGLHCLSMSHKKDIGLIWVKCK